VRAWETTFAAILISFSRGVAEGLPTPFLVLGEVAVEEGDLAFALEGEDVRGDVDNTMKFLNFAGPNAYFTCYGLAGCSSRIGLAPIVTGAPAVTATVLPTRSR